MGLPVSVLRSTLRSAQSGPGRARPPPAGAFAPTRRARPSEVLASRGRTETGSWPVFLSSAAVRYGSPLQALTPVLRSTLRSAQSGPGRARPPLGGCVRTQQAGASLRSAHFGGPLGNGFVTRFLQQDRCQALPPVHLGPGSAIHPPVCPKQTGTRPPALRRVRSHPPGRTRPSGVLASRDRPETGLWPVSFSGAAVND